MPNCQVAPSLDGIRWYISLLQLGSCKLSKASPRSSSSLVALSWIIQQISLGKTRPVERFRNKVQTKLERGCHRQTRPCIAYRIGTKGVWAEWTMHCILAHYILGSKPKFLTCALLHIYPLNWLDAIVECGLLVSIEQPYQLSYIHLGCLLYYKKQNYKEETRRRSRL